MLRETGDSGMKWAPTNWVAAPETHEKKERQWVLDNVPKGGVFIDVGADIGSWTINLASHFDKVYAIEPSEGDMPILIENIRLNNLEDKVEWRRVAASDKEGLLYLSSRSIDAVSNWLASIDPPQWDRWEVVNAITLDSMGLSPRLIKIDVEGWGGKVLEGASKTLASTDFVVFEIHNDNEKNFMIEILAQSFNVAHKSDSDSIWYWRKR